MRMRLKVTEEGKGKTVMMTVAQALHQYRFANEFLVIANNAYSEAAKSGKDEMLARGTRGWGRRRRIRAWLVMELEYKNRNDKFHNSHI